MLYMGMVILVSLSSCEDILEVPDISNQTVSILAPTEGSSLTTNVVGFNWEAVEDATAYTVQVATPNFENAAQFNLDSVVQVDTLGQITTRINQTLFNGNYQWRVKAFNSDYETVYTQSSFQVNGDEDLDLTPPNTPQLVAPANGAAQTETTVDFSWTREDVAGTPERDSIFVYSDETLGSLTTKALGANKTYSTTVSAGTYYWLVKAYDAGGNESDASTTFNFTIE